MQRILIELFLAIALTLGAILASVTGANANELMVSAAFARASATSAAKSGAAYVSIKNNGTEADRLIKVTTPMARTASLHEMIGIPIDGEMGAEVKTMGYLETLEIPAGGSVEMKPGGIHIMLMGLTAPLKRGKTIEMTLRFEKAGEIKVMVPVGGVADGSP